MNVAVVNDFAHFNGGAATVAIASAIGLSRRGHLVTLFSAVGPVAPELEAAEVEVICTGQHEILKDPNRLRAMAQGIWNVYAARRFAHWLATAEREDSVVHLHGWSKALSASVARTAFDHGFKVVCTLHDYFAACPNGGFFDYQSLSHCDLRPMSLACVMRHCDSRSYSHKAWRVMRQMLQKHAGKMPAGIDAFIVMSRLSRDILEPYLPEGARVFAVPNPIDVLRQAPVDAARNRTYTMVGRLTPEKGGELFARAAHDCGVPALFVGEGQTHPQIAAAYPAAVVTGWISRERVGKFLSQTRALVFPSLWYEAQGLVVLEAAARGVPAIVSDGCAARELVEHGVTGLHFENGSAESLAAALRRMADGQFAGLLGRNAYRRFWHNPPGLERHVCELESVYSTILERQGAGPASSPEHGPATL